jgi:DNA-binding CsgD family transcriptional regulator
VCRARRARRGHGSTESGPYERITALRAGPPPCTPPRIEVGAAAGVDPNASTGTGAQTGRMLGQSAMYDRHGDLELLLAPLAVTESGSLTVVEGPAGIGKTRLLTEGAHWAREHGWRVLRARGLELERHFSFGVVRQLFEPFLTDLAPDPLADCLRGPAAITARLFPFLPLHGRDGDPHADGSFALLHGLTWLVINLAATRPLLLQVDDLQWADEASLRWFAYLLPRIEEVSVAVVVAQRQDGNPPELAQRITCDPRAVVVRPQQLRPSSVGRMLGSLLDQEPDAEFVLACHAQTAGNPLYVREVAAWLKAERVTPTAAGIDRLAAIGGQAVARRVAVRLGQLSEAAVTVARAVAVLGDGADLHQVSSLAGLPYETVTDAVVALMQADVLVDRVPLSFVHPVVRTAVYEGAPLDRRSTLHAAAAALLVGASADAERVAGHLLLAPPGLDFTVAVLRRAARDAVSRGAASSAFAYLGRCRQERLEPDELREVLVEQGMTGQLVDLGTSVNCLRLAYDSISDPLPRADIAWRLAAGLLFANRLDEAVSVLRTSMAALPAGVPEAEDLRQRAGAMELFVSTFVPDRPDLLRNLDRLRALPPSPGPGGRMLTSAITLRDAMGGDPRAVPEARELAGQQLAGLDISSLAASWHVLIAADVEDAVGHLDQVISRLHRHGDLTALANAYTFRTHCWAQRGQLAEAIADGRQAQRVQEAAGVDLGRPFCGAFLAEALIDHGELDQAQQALDWTGVLDESSPGHPQHYVLCMRARLARLRGAATAGVEYARSAGRIFTGLGADNPAMLCWRSELALCLHAAGNQDEALPHAEREVTLARRWGAPRALGRALRTRAIVGPVEDRGRLLAQSVAVLDGSPAPLELARSLFDLGWWQLRAGDRPVARETLRRSLELASACGARTLADEVRGQLKVAGARLRHEELRGHSTLTPSERRVADLATGGATNREIAEALFVTPKTVELHLTNVYRKLGIASRIDLSAAMQTS